jgi:ABC-type nitrate/sulfonate/bicarbonate transport system substrate-binding protein
MEIRCGAVPEHFFYPWMAWLEKSGGQKSGWIWKEFPGGSGAMIQAMKEEDLDAAFLLTEAAIAAQAKGEEIEILFPYVTSPLQWGIFTGNQNSIKTVSQGKNYAISRFTSGSHLMAILEGESRGAEIAADQWKIAGNLEGARTMLLSGEADLFFWEKWMTAPLVDSGEFRMLDVFSGPWPAFVFCVSRKWLDSNDLMKRIITDFDEVCRQAQAFKKMGKESAALISASYGLSESDAAEWLRETEWSESAASDLQFMEPTKALMRRAGIIE